jgi:hypothetical protein
MEIAKKCNKKMMGMRSQKKKMIHHDSHKGDRREYKDTKKGGI